MARGGRGLLRLPKTWNDRRRSLVGALLTYAVMGASVIVPVTQVTVVAQLAWPGESALRSASR
jgi:hypothetical protein